VIKTVGKAVKLYREQEWSQTFNEGVQLYNDKNIDEAIQYFELSSRIDPNKSQSYVTLAQIYVESKDLQNAKELVDKAISIDPNDEQAIVTAGNIASLEDDKLKAIQYYLRAADISSKPAPIMKKLIFLYIDLEEYEQAIDYSMKVLKSYPYDSDIYYNIGVLYQRIALNQFNVARDNFLIVSDMEKRDPSELQKILDGFQQARLNSIEAREYFQQAWDLEVEDTGAKEAVSEMKKLKEQLDMIFIPSVEEMME
ncbi:MAG: tetratricopeptide repeat protein, partial [Fidelibacterota bacterium]